MAVSLTARVLLGLVLGFAVGLLISANPSLARVPGWIEPVGTIFINAIKMTVIPLVVASLIVGVASAPDPATVGRLGGRAALWFIGIVLVSAFIGVLVTPLALSVIEPDPARIEALRSSTAGAEFVERAKGIPKFSQWLTELVPVNPIRAAADTAMLPLIVFSVLFGAALMRVESARRQAMLLALQGVQDASFVLVRWVLIAAPVGVFALAMPLAARLGVSAAGAVVWYIGVVSALCVAFMALVLYPLACIGGRIAFRDFARAALPVQAVAMSSRSSMGSLPVMIEQLGGTLGFTREITGFLLPLSASVFRAGAGIGITGGVCFLAALYGVHLTVPQLATIALTTTLLSFSVPGIPAGSIIVMVPVLLAAHLPVEGVGILIAVDAIPDMFRTTTNVTGTMAVAAVLGGRNRTPVTKAG
jgi:Na+/H+-dicarboxylate symporter